MEAQSVPTSPRILLAVDQVGSAVGAATEAIRRASETGAEIVVLSVVESRNLHLPGGPVRRVDQERERLASGAQTIVRRAHEAGVRAAYLIWEGDPAESIIEASIAEGADLIMLGSRPRTNLRRLILGSVSSEVARRAPCEVIVVPS